MAHTQRNQQRSPSDDHGGSDNTRPPKAMDDKQRGQENKVTKSPRKRAPQAEGGKRHE